MPRVYSGAVMQWWVLLIFFVVSVFEGGLAHAAVERECIVSVRVGGGWSLENKRKVHFVTGLELARITKTMKVDFHQHYAIIWHGSGLPTVAKLDGMLLGVGREFSADDFLRLFERDAERRATQIEGEGQGLTWRIRARPPEGWVDPQGVAVTRVSR